MLFLGFPNDNNKSDIVLYKFEYSYVLNSYNAYFIQWLFYLEIPRNIILKASICLGISRNFPLRYFQNSIPKNVSLRYFQTRPIQTTWRAHLFLFFTHFIILLIHTNILQVNLLYFIYYYIFSIFSASRMFCY